MFQDDDLLLPVGIGLCLGLHLLWVLLRHAPHINLQILAGFHIRPFPSSLHLSCPLLSCARHHVDLGFKGEGKSALECLRERQRPFNQAYQGDKFYHNVAALLSQQAFHLLTGMPVGFGEPALTYRSHFLRNQYLLMLRGCWQAGRE